MTDKELAAKAAGLELVGPMGDNGLLLFNGKYWNPLTDDGHATQVEPAQESACGTIGA